MTESVRYSIAHMDGLIRANQKRKDLLRKAGRLDEFNRPVAPPTLKSTSEDKKAKGVPHKAYCLKCKSTKDVETKEIRDTPQGRAGHVVGTCPDCGTETHAFKKRTEADQLKQALASASASYAYPV